MRGIAHGPLPICRQPIFQSLREGADRFICPGGFSEGRLGYQYQPGADGEFVPKAEIEALVERHKQAGFEFGTNPTSYGPSEF